MKLEYRILWIENESDWVESIEDQIQEYLENLEFIYSRELIAKEESGIDYNKYDLILMDLNLADHPNGAELISKIRELGVYTDVVFYSARVDELKVQGKDKGLEGVYYSGRTPEDSFVRKVTTVIDTTIKKVQDLNNIRGLVMAEVSELDTLMSSLIDAYYIKNGSDEKSKVFRKHLVEDIEKTTRNKLSGSENCDKKCKHKWHSLPISSIISDFEFDASRKARAIKLIIETEKIPYTPQNSNFYEDYRIEMLTMRNHLAHCISRRKEGKEILITKNGEVEFDDNRFREIRQQIRKYNNLFNEIDKRINVNN